MKRLCLALLFAGSSTFLAPFYATAESGKEDKCVSETLQRAQVQYKKGAWSDALKLYKKAYNAIPKSCKSRVVAALEWSHLLWEQGKYTRAEKRANRALELSKQQDAKDLLGRLLLTIGHIEASLGKLQSARDTLRICAKMAQKRGDKVFSGLCRLNKDLVDTMMGESTTGEKSYRDAVEDVRSGQTSLSIATALAKTAELYEKQKQYDKAAELLEDAHGYFQKARSTPAVAKNKLRLARLYQDRQKHEKASKYLEGLVSTFEKMGSKPSLVHAHELKGRALDNSGDHTRARNHFQKSLAAANATGSPQLIGKAQLQLCEFYVRRDRIQRAAPICKKARSKFKQVGMQTLLARTQAQLAEVQHRLQNLSKAKKYYLKSIAGLEKHAGEYAEILARHHANLCQIEMLMNSSKAQQRCTNALDRLKSIDDPDTSMVASTHYGIGITARRAEDQDKARKHLEKAIELASKPDVRDIDLATDAHLRLGVLLAGHENEPDKARNVLKAGLEKIQGSEAPDEYLIAEIELRKQLGQVARNQGDWKQVIDILEPLVDKLEKSVRDENQTYAWTYQSLAKAHLNLDHDAAAKHALQAALPYAEKLDDKEMAKSIKESLEQF